MEREKRRALEVAGWRFGDAADFLGMTDEERQLLDARVEAGLAVRRQRETVKLTQRQLASRIKTSQPRVAKIERAASDVSFDQILRAFAAAGGRITVKRLDSTEPSKPSRRPARAGQKKRRVKKPEATEVQIDLIGTEL